MPDQVWKGVEFFGGAEFYVGKFEPNVTDPAKLAALAASVAQGFATYATSVARLDTGSTRERARRAGADVEASQAALLRQFEPVAEATGSMMRAVRFRVSDGTDFRRVVAQNSQGTITRRL